MQPYPYVLSQLESGSWMLRFRDIPEAITSAPTPEETMGLAGDALSATLESYLELKQTIPSPSRPEKGDNIATPSLFISLKVALHQALAERNMRAADLARLMDVHYTAAARLLDPGHMSRIDAMEHALAALGKHAGLVVGDIAA